MRPSVLNPLFAPLGSVSGIGPKMLPLYQKLLAPPERPACVLDLLFHLPVTAIDRSHRALLAETEPDTLTTFTLRVLRHRPPPPGRPNLPYRILCEDDSGDIELVFFNSRRLRLDQTMPEGSIRYISGRYTLYDGSRQMVHPDRIMDEASFAKSPLIEPVYGQTAGLTSRLIHKCIGTALARLPALPEWHDASLIRQEKFPAFAEALTRLHQPDSTAAVTEAGATRRRLAYDEVLAGQLALLLMRNQMKRESGLARRSNGEVRARVLQALPYDLTGAQKQAVDDIIRDLQSPERMLRLLQGDVGSGKTIVAFLAMVEAVESGYQSALMAPTEILARQHFERLQPLAEAAGLKIAVLTGRDKGKSRKALLDQLAAGAIDLLIGTHALFQDDVVFKALGLAVIDEQHRFGVHQRLALSRKGQAVDVLVMTATPIPRTLVLTFFGDMDVSVLREKPAGRQKIDTRTIRLDRIGEVTDGLERALAAGQQIYWICPLVEENEELDLTAVNARYKALTERFGAQVGLLHGQMPIAEKDAAMQAFASGHTRLLVATTVVEVGVDVPNASIMVIEHAERFGLSQLHQLRGRIGRGAAKSTCLLLYAADAGQIARARLDVMRQSEDGFFIAEEDLRLRGEGDVLGTRQSGMPGFRFALPEHHARLLSMARDDAKLILEKDAQLQSERGQALRALLYLFERDAAIRWVKAG
jgi:ATP-dependent DNA helicase RecG